MAEKVAPVSEEFERASSLVKTHGIISIILGALGVLGGLVALVIFAILSTLPASESDVIFFFIIGLITLLFFILPHVYLIVSGIQLYNLPVPRVARILVIINLVVSLIWGNIIILVFAILNLVQLGDYEKGFKKK